MSGERPTEAQLQDAIIGSLRAAVRTHDEHPYYWTTERDLVFSIRHELVSRLPVLLDARRRSDGGHPHLAGPMLRSEWANVDITIVEPDAYAPGKNDYYMTSDFLAQIEVKPAWAGWRDRVADVRKLADDSVPINIAFGLFEKTDRAAWERVANAARRHPEVTAISNFGAVGPLAAAWTK